MLESEADRLAMIRAVGDDVAQVNDRDVYVVFTDEHVPMQFANFMIDGTSPQIVARTSDLGDIDDNSLVVVRNVEYRVAGLEPDGTGMTLVRLRKQ